MLFVGCSVVAVPGYKRVKRRSHPVGKRPNMHPHKPHAPSQSSRLSHTYRPSTQLFGSGSAWLVHSCVCGFRGNAWPLLLSLCYMENKTSARHRLERQCNACDNCKKQCRHKETKPNSNAIQPRERHNNPNNPTNIHTPNRITSTHTPLTSHVYRDAAACTRSTGG